MNKENQTMLTFNELRQANIKRLPQFKNRHGLPAHSQPDGSDWSDSDWLQAVVGELGEYANVRKKLLRGDYSPEEAYSLMRDELADVICYLDILAYRLDIDLGDAVIDKFNRVSDRVGSNIKLNNEKQQNVLPQELIQLLNKNSGENWEVTIHPKYVNPLINMSLKNGWYVPDYYEISQTANEKLQKSLQLTKNKTIAIIYIDNEENNE